ncbi:MAG: thermonuclease family protein [Alicyclobacillaceae bacterium]|nr:thermonuclease family protein [Alicyclobacillaceae bacterium]
MAKKKAGRFGIWRIIGILILIGVVLTIIKYVGWLVSIGLLTWGGYKWYKNRKIQVRSKKPYASIASGVLLFFIWLAVAGTDAQTSTSHAPPKETAQPAPNQHNPSPAPAPSPSPANSQQPQSTQQKFIMAHVAKVVDGDTMEVTYDGKHDTIRLLLIDTPETHKPDTPVEPFGPEAADFAAKTLADKDVKLELDGPERDKYGRLLCYLWIGDQLFNKMQIEKGYARVAYVYNPPYKHYDELVAAEQKAKQDKVGIWSIPGYVTDNGYNVEIAKQWTANQQQAHANANKPHTQAGPQQAVSTQRQTQVQQTVYYRNCSEVRAAGKAPLHRGEPGYRPELDRDGDGIACE